MNNQRHPTTFILVAFVIAGQVCAQATIEIPYLVSLNEGDTIVIGEEFANVDSLFFAPHRHRLSLNCHWVYDPSEKENLGNALEDARAEGWAVEQF